MERFALAADLSRLPEADRLFERVSTECSEMTSKFLTSFPTSNRYPPLNLPDQGEHRASPDRRGHWAERPHNCTRAWRRR